MNAEKNANKNKGGRSPPKFSDSRPPKCGKTTKKPGCEFRPGNPKKWAWDLEIWHDMNIITTVINVETEHHHYWNHRDHDRHHGHDHDHHRHHIRMTVSSSSCGYHGNQHQHYGPKSHHSGSQTKTPQSAEASIKRKMEGCFFLAPCSSSLPLLFF